MAKTTVEELNFYVVNYGSEDDVYGPQLLMTRLASHEGDIYMVDEQTFASFVAQELATPLDEYIESGALDVTGQDLETVTRAAPARSGRKRQHDIQQRTPCICAAGRAAIRVHQ